MILEARMNLQKGKEENRRYKGTTYDVQDPLDLYIIQRSKMLDQMKNKKDQEAEEKAAAAYIEKIIENELNKILKDLI